MKALKAFVMVGTFVLMYGVLMGANGPVTSNIQKTVGMGANTASPVNVAISPTATPVAANPYDANRIDYKCDVFSATGTAYACCSLGGVGGQALTATPTISGTGCGVGFYVPLGLWSEVDTPRNALYCVTSGGTVTFSCKNNE